ncbi:MAG: response regulator [Geobacteraceae bacterium]|nr:response regulator [Geobacteraceae bacterium]
MEKVKILLAETDCIFIELMKTFLRGSGFELVTCQKQDFLLETVRQANPAVVYLSANIAGSNLEYLRLIKQDDGTRKIPVVMICSKENKEYQLRSSASGCEYVLLKPLQRKTFFSSLYGFTDSTGLSNARLKTRLAVDYGFLTPAPFTFHSVDLGSRGMFVEIRNVLPVDTILSIRFHLPDIQTPIETSARVAWLNPPLDPAKPSLPPGMGLEFVDLDPEQAAIITGFIIEGNRRKQRKAE